MYVTEYTEKIMKYTCNDNDDIVQNAFEHVNQIPNDIRIDILYFIAFDLQNENQNLK